MVTETEVLRLQQEYTDKYVMVDESRPELARFRDIVGVVKTINYNGRALVEFLDYHANIGWFDVALDYVRVVPKPDPNAKKEKAAAKPAGVPAAKAAAPAKASAAAKPAAGKSSTADILAAARAKAGGAAPAAKPAGGKMSTADILAASRAKAQPAAETEAVEESTIEEAAAPAPKAAAKPAAGKPAGPMPTTTDGKIEYCRKVDAKG